MTIFTEFEGNFGFAIEQFGGVHSLVNDRRTFGVHFRCEFVQLHARSAFTRQLDREFGPFGPNERRQLITHLEPD